MWLLVSARKRGRRNAYLSVCEVDDGRCYYGLSRPFLLSVFLLLVELNLRFWDRLQIDFLILEGKLKFTVRISIGGKEPMKSAEKYAHVLCGWIGWTPQDHLTIVNIWYSFKLCSEFGTYPSEFDPESFADGPVRDRQRAGCSPRAGQCPGLF